MPTHQRGVSEGVLWYVEHDDEEDNEGSALILELEL